MNINKIEFKAKPKSIYANSHVNFYSRRNTKRKKERKMEQSYVLPKITSIFLP